MHSFRPPSLRQLFPALALGLALNVSAFSSLAHADTRIFLLDSATGYGVDTCLTSGASCGAQIAAAWCRSHDYERVLDYGPVDRSSSTVRLTGTNIPACRTDEACPAVVAITCSR